MRIYVAGRTDDILRIKRMQNACKLNGHKITYDWTENVNAQSLALNSGVVVDDNTKRQYAEKDLVGVYSSDLLIACCAPGWLGTAIEFGLALAWNKPIWLVGTPERESVFFELAHVTRYENDLMVYKALYEASPYALERQAPAPIILEP